MGFLKQVLELIKNFISYFNVVLWYNLDFSPIFITRIIAKKLEHMLLFQESLDYRDEDIIKSISEAQKMWANYENEPWIAQMEADFNYSDADFTEVLRDPAKFGMFGGFTKTEDAYRGSYISIMVGSLMNLDKWVD